MNGKLTLHPKTAGAGISGAVAILIVYILSLCGVTIDPTAAASLATVIAGLGAWLAPLLARDRPVGS